MGAPACWTGYIWVADVDAACAETRRRRAARSSARPTDIPGVGRFAVVADPQGAIFMLFRDAGGNPPPRPAVGTPGLVGWHELMRGMARRRFAFYADLFGWKKDSEFDMGPMGVYYLFSTGHGEFGGIMTRHAQVPHPVWRYYFNVEAIDAAAGRVAAKGGKVVSGPHGGAGRPFVLHAVDQQGAYFALVAGKR